MSSPATPVVPGIRLGLVYLARLREAFGRAGETLTMPVPDTAAAPSVADVIALLRARGGAFATELAPGRAVRLAVNHDVVPADHRLHDGDEIALFPPVTGG